METVIISGAVLWAIYFLVQKYRPRKKTSSGCASNCCKWYKNNFRYAL